MFVLHGQRGVTGFLVCFEHSYFVGGRKCRGERGLRTLASKVGRFYLLREATGVKERLLPTDRSPVASPRPYEGLWREHATPSTSPTSLDPLSDRCSIVSSIDPLPRVYLLPLYHEKHTWILLKSATCCSVLRSHYFENGSVCYVTGFKRINIDVRSGEITRLGELEKLTDIF